MKMFFMTIVLALPFYACDPPVHHIADDCPPCPNNTICQSGDCGCPPDRYDMGSWCLQKADNLFVAASLDCHCLDVVGLYLWSLNPETGNGSVPSSSFSLIGRGNCQSANQSNFAYYPRPDGDSIAIYALTMPTPNSDFYCRINDKLRCSADLFGKFHGPDTIQTTVVWHRCVDNAGNDDPYTETAHLTFLRWK